MRFPSKQAIKGNKLIRDIPIEHQRVQGQGDKDRAGASSQRTLWLHQLYAYVHVRVYIL